MEGLTTTGSAEFVRPRHAMAVLQNGVDLARRAEEVFDYLSDLRNEREWNPKMRLVEALTDGPPHVGSKFRAQWQGSPVTIVEYASMTCGHCATFHAKTYPVLKQRYIDTGKVKYIMREFPLDPLAAAGFMLARCAGKDKYYPMIEVLFAKQNEWAVQQPIPPLTAIAKQAGFTQEKFESCLSDQKILDGIEATRAHGSQKLGVNSTPTFFVNGKVMRGAVTIEELEKEILPLLKS